jgi:sulfane dehydrogenase subunit SoxC
MNSTGKNRRQLLKGGAALAGLALAGVGSARGQEGAQEGGNMQGGARRAAGWDPDHPWGVNPEPYWPANSEYGEGESGGKRIPLKYRVGIITPAESHFTSNHRSPTPNVDASKHTLLVHGMVDRPLVFTMADLKSFPAVSVIHYVACAGDGGFNHLGSRQNYSKMNVSQIHSATACSEWTGVPVSTILREVGVQQGGNWLVSVSMDAKKHQMTVPLAKGMDDALLAYGQNGAPIRPGQGYPLRLLVPGFEGTRNVKWLSRIKVTNQPQWSHYESASYSNVKPYDGKGRNFQFEMEPGGAIIYPSLGDQLHGPGLYEVTGVAWSGGGAVHRVEISADGGKTWKDAELLAPVLRKAHTRFRMSWRWDGQEAMLISRTTDDNGDVQPTFSEFSKIWHVTPDYWQKSNQSCQHFNACQPWKIDREGRITNAMFDPSYNT